MKNILLLALACTPGLVPAAAQPGAVTRQWVRPVLIRNEHNTLLRLTVNAQQPFVQVKSITVSLDGASDLESLQFYCTGEKTGFSSDKPFGERMEAEQTMVFKGHARLNAGAIHFWLFERISIAELLKR